MRDRQPDLLGDGVFMVLLIGAAMLGALAAAAYFNYERGLSNRRGVEEAQAAASAIAKQDNTAIDALTEQVAGISSQSRLLIGIFSVIIAVLLTSLGLLLAHILMTP